jgi:AcrR family transcriptional regulator
MSDAAPDKPDLILDAAERLFTQFGYRRTSVEDVAREAGVAKGTVYLYFESKVALFRAMQTRLIAVSARLSDESEAKGGALADRLFGQLRATYGLMHARYGRSDHLSELSATLASIGADLADASEKAYADRLSRIIDSARSFPSKAGPDTAGVVETLRAAARGAKSERGLPVDAALYDERLRNIARVIAAALQTTSSD